MRLTRLSVLAALAGGALACSDNTVGLETFDPGPRDLVVPATVTVAQDDSMLIQVDVVRQGTTDVILSNSGTVFEPEDPDVAAVGRVDSGELYVYGIMPGTTEMTVNYFGTTTTMTVTVTADPTASLNITPSTLNLFVGEDTLVNITGTLASGRALTAGRATFDYVTEGDTSMVSFADAVLMPVVDSNNDTTMVLRAAISPLAPGDVTLTLTSDEMTQDLTIHVSLRPVATVTLDPDGAVMKVADTRTLTPTISAANGEELNTEGRTSAWTSSNTNVATVDEDGVVTAVGAGSATITFTVDGQAGTSEILVTN